MSLGQELSASSDSESESDISELKLIPNILALLSANERDKPCALGYDSESSYDPSVLTEDEEFLDDTDDSCSSNDSYRPYDSDSDDSDDNGSEDSDSEDGDSEDGDSEDDDSGDDDFEDGDSGDDDSEDGDSNGYNSPNDLTKIVDCSNRIDYKCTTEDTTCHSEPLIDGTLKTSKRR
jgi:hypothetical protein